MQYYEFQTPVIHILIEMLWSESLSYIVFSYSLLNGPIHITLIIKTKSVVMFCARVDQDAFRLWVMFRCKI